MPIPPRPLPGGAIDPRHHGDDHANRPPDRDHRGQPVTQQPWRDHNGRYIPPGREHIGWMDRGDWRDNIRREQSRWDRNDHGYHWYDWNGARICHRYDDYGYHWWGFYIGATYFWTRYDNDMYWWYDPYWHRWVYLHDGRWWWQDGGGIVYVIIDNNYYRYGDNGGTVIVAPDPAPPVEVPPGQTTAPAPTDETMFYSEDGTRSVQILGDRKEAFLYDLTIEDQTDRKARGRWLGAGVKSAKFVYDDKTGADGTQTQELRQIQLAFDEDGKSAVSDVNGEREVVIEGAARTASLYNLKDDTIDPVFLADGATGVNLINEDKQDASGNAVPTLKLVTVSAADENGVESTYMFDRNGAPYDSSVEAPSEPPSPPSPSSAERQTLLLQQRLQASPALKALREGAAW